LQRYQGGTKLQERRQLTMSSNATAKLMKSAFEVLLSPKSKGFDRVLSKCRFVEGNVGRCVASLVIEEEHTNKTGTLHGGFSALLVDNISTLALTLPEGQSFNYGVSVNMDLSYLKAAKVGEEILIEANVLKRGRTLAFLEVELRKKETNELLVKGSHTKYIGS